MIPRFPVAVDPTVPTDAAYWVPSQEELDEGQPIGFFHDTERLIVDVEEASRVMAAERIAIGFADAHAATVAAFEEILDQAEYEVPDVPSDEAPAFILDAPWYGVNGLEVGVSGLVHALNAVGVVTAASCRGHVASHRNWAPGPTAVFAADRSQVGLLAPLVALSGCGFEINTVDHPRLLAVVAPSVAETMDLADRVLAAADSFR